MLLHFVKEDGVRCIEKFLIVVFLVHASRSWEGACKQDGSEWQQRSPWVPQVPSWHIQDRLRGEGNAERR